MPPASSAPGSARRGRSLAAPSPHWTSLCTAVACLVPGAVGTWLSSGAPGWRSDAATLPLLGAATPLQGGVSALLGQLLTLLPVGHGASRAAALGGLALGAAGALTFGLARELLDRNGPAPRLNPVLAAAAAVAATLSVSWLAEGTTLGGFAVAAALGLGTLRAFDAGTAGRSRGAPTSPSAPYRAQPETEHDADSEGSALRAVATGALLGATAWEHLATAFAVFAVLLVRLWQRGQVPSRVEAGLFGGSAATVLAAALVPAGLAPALVPLRSLRVERVATFAPGLEDWFGGSESGASLIGSLDPARWLDEVGLLLLVAALVGGVWALGSRALRGPAAPLLLWVGLDLFWGGVARDDGPVLPLHLLALVSLASLAALGVQTAVRLLERTALPGARPALVLLTVLTLAVTWAGAEDAARVVERRNQVATETWTDETLAALPYRALVLASSRPVVQRLAVALASGARDDVTLVPLPLLGRGALAAELLELEPALALLIRELSTSGRPSEQALTALADARPLFVEARGEWDRRLVAHLVPGPFLARFAPHPLGRSDRIVAAAGQQQTFERVLAAASGPTQGQRRSFDPETPDPATLSVLTSAAQEQRTLLTVLGDKHEAAELTKRLERLEGSGASARATKPTQLASR